MVDPAEPDNRDPRRALQWYWGRWLLFWAKIAEMDTRLHEALYTRFPTPMRIGGRLVRWCYGLSISPAFAVILTLLLVGLVISDVVPIIVSLSVFVAWLVAILSIARAESVNKLRIGRRIVVVFGLAALMAVGANRYVRWCLVNYYKHHPQVDIKPHDNTDRLAYERLKELIHEELSHYAQLAATEQKREQRRSPSDQVPPQQQPPVIIQIPAIGNLKQRTVTLSDAIMENLIMHGWPAHDRLQHYVIQQMPIGNRDELQQWMERRSEYFRFRHLAKVKSIRDELAQLHLKDDRLDEFLQDEAREEAGVDKRFPSRLIDPLQIEDVAHRLKALADQIKE